MATVYGVTDKGFVAKPLDTIIQDLNNKFIGRFGTTFDVSPESPDGQIIGIIANEISECWQQAQHGFNGFRPGAVAGVGLDAICELTGIIRYVNRPTKVTVELTGDSGTLVEAGSLVGDGTNEFTTDNDVSLPGDVTVTCTKSGEIYIAKNTVNKVLTEVSGWTGCNNLDEGVTGVDYEKDQALRARRDRTTVKGSATVEAIYSALSDLDLSYIRIRDNDTGSSIGDQPTGSIFIVVDGGTKNDIAQRIFDKKTAGVQTFGSESVIVKDSKGYPKEIRFSRSSLEPVYISGKFRRLPGSNLGSNDVVLNLKEAVSKYINGLSPGAPVVWSYIFSPLLESSPGIQIDSLYIGLEENPTGTSTLNLEIDKRAHAELDNITFSESE